MSAEAAYGIGKYLCLKRRLGSNSEEYQKMAANAFWSLIMCVIDIGGVSSYG
jgi:hypothetical protein